MKTNDKINGNIFFFNNFTINNSYHIQDLYPCILTKLFLSSSKWQLEWNHDLWHFIYDYESGKMLIYSLMIALNLYIEIPVFYTYICLTNNSCQLLYKCRINLKDYRSCIIACSSAPCMTIKPSNSTWRNLKLCSGKLNTTNSQYLFVRYSQ